MKMFSLLLSWLSVLVVGCMGQAGQTGRYPESYNLIDADPSCRYDIPDDVCCVSDKSAQCPTIYSGPGDVDVMAIHPNIFERVEFLTRNMARMYPKYYSNSEWGWGTSSYASDCDQPDPLPTKPFYFMSEATQAARWNSFSGATTYSGCDRSNDNHTCDDAQTSHFTCCDYCQYNTWGLCGYLYRTKGMVQLLFTSNAWNDIGSEGIWCCNTAYTSSSSHCGMVFNYQYEHQGIGYYPSGSTTMVGIKDTDDWEDHVFPHATHFDWNDDEYTFLVQFFGGKKDPAAEVNTVYLLYNGQLLEMDELISNSTRSNGTNAFYQLKFNNTNSCEPYAFVAKDLNNGTWWRLPEDENYYFSTVSFPDDLISDTANCDENHYFYNSNNQEWVANGAYNLTNEKNSDNGCVGCTKIDSLQTIYNNIDDYVDTSDDSGTDSSGSGNSGGVSTTMGTDGGNSNPSTTDMDDTNGGDNGSTTNETNSNETTNESNETTEDTDDSGDGDNNVISTKNGGNILSPLLEIYICICMWYMGN